MKRIRLERMKTYQNPVPRSRSCKAAGGVNSKKNIDASRWNSCLEIHGQLVLSVLHGFALYKKDFHNLDAPKPPSLLRGFEILISYPASRKLAQVPAKKI